MKLLVLSDSHRNIKRMELAVKQTKPDVIMHLGDNILDAIELYQKYPFIAFNAVRGNCDSPSNGNDDKLLTLESVTIYMTHGHRCDVKNGLRLLTSLARGKGADLALFGHTHIAEIIQEQDITLMNPGQLLHHNNDISASYGIVNIADGQFDCEIVWLPDDF